MREAVTDAAIVRGKGPHARLRVCQLVSLVPRKGRGAHGAHVQRSVRRHCKAGGFL